MDIGIETGLNTGRIVRKFFLGATLLLIIILYSVTSTVIKDTDLGLMKNCLDSKIGEPVFVNNGRIIGPTAANTILDDYFNETHRFLKSELNECGAAYIFNATTTQYMVCENGNVYEYGKICKTKSIKEKTVQLIDTLNNKTNTTK